MKTNNWEAKAYKEGWSAGFADNYADYKNPYIPDTIDSKLWSEGYSDGLRNWDMNMNDGG
jgi:hypothetical protein